MYSPALGRFLSMDPLGYTAGDANLYRYVFNNPINLTDPSGKILSTAGGVGQALLNIILGALQLDACGNLPDKVVIVDVGQVGAMPISVIILPPGSGRLPPSQTLGKVFNTIGAANDVVETLSSLALIPGVPDALGGIDLLWALAGSIANGETFLGRPHSSAPLMIAIGQDVWVTGLEAALLPPIKAGLFYAGFYFGSIPGGVAGEIAGSVLDAGTSAASFLYDTARLTGAIPNVVSLALFLDERAPTRLPIPGFPPGQPGIAVLIYLAEWFVYEPLIPE